MKRFGLICLFVFVLLGTLIATMPLGFAMERAGLRNAGLTWVTAKGSVFDGSTPQLIYSVTPKEWIWD